MTRLVTVIELLWLMHLTSSSREAYNARNLIIAHSKQLYVSVPDVSPIPTHRFLRIIPVHELDICLPSIRISMNSYRSNTTFLKKRGYIFFVRIKWKSSHFHTTVAIATELTHSSAKLPVVTG